MKATRSPKIFVVMIVPIEFVEQDIIEFAYCFSCIRQPVVVVVSSPRQSPRCGVSLLRSAQSTTIPLSVWSASISPAH